MIEWFRLSVATLLFILWMLMTLVLLCTFLGIGVILEDDWRTIGNKLLETIRGN